MALQPGDRFGRYELVSWLGRGGMAETWRARWTGDAGVTKAVLIKKVLPEFVADDAFVSMFINEARISATLSHGNIAQVLDFGRVEGQYYLAMELVDGQPLHHILKRAAKTGLPRLPIPLATYIAVEMCRGLHYAHTRTGDKGMPLGIVHRDISPDNVLISYEGQVKIVDFGIAKARLVRNFQTEPGVVKGKFMFFSPEQARGLEVDARTDVWATGLVLYEMLCGQLPVTGTQAAVLMRMAHGEFPSPRAVFPELPAELDALVMKALSVEASGRYESANAFGDALAGFLYSHAPRFSAMNLAYLTRSLFREDVAQEGRELSVPSSFVDELTLWRQPADAPSSTPSRAAMEGGLSQDGMPKPLPQRTKRKLLPAVVAPPEDHAAVAPAPRGKPSSRVLGSALVVLLVVGLGLGAYAFLWDATGKGRDAPAAPVATRDSGVNPAYPIPGQIGGMPPKPKSAAEVAESYRKWAQRALDGGSYQSAIDFAKQCLETVEDHAECLMISGASLAREGRFDEAVSRYQRFVERHPEHSLVGTARTLMEEYSRRSEARKPVQRPAPSKPVSKAKPSTTGYTVVYDAAAPPPSVNDLVRRARDLRKRKEHREVLAVTAECLAVAPDNADCHLMRGLSFEELNMREAGIEHFRQFLVVAPASHPVHAPVDKLVKAYDKWRAEGGK
ncbi:serine/threonine-protein kinase [Myxococcus qinghaiensis]|uniref:serine/threonine-protein kinase n=1 Tax=Myxococcus qinghaiensis TaxID=2906758 RepID=UPI0020A7D284|nr:serine/threonine-protein kinase [Myxococcus qinghaiensis]MCP3169586.1 protein kinase [Myxococcus qinghaiensis]